MESAGRWSRLRLGSLAPPPDLPAGATAGALTRGAPEPEPRWDEAEVERMARGLLRRYGVVFRRLMEREGLAPSWRELLRVYRRMEARGELRGGRFVAGHAGEQYALPEAVGLLRGLRKKPAAGELVALSAADPLNLLGIVLPGPRLAAVPSNRLVLRDGLPVAVRDGGHIRHLEELPRDVAWRVEQLLLRHREPPHLRRLMRRR
jgi:ATP-dependent Lhr-like helicase